MIYLFLSFILDGLIINNSFFYPLFTLVSLVIIFPKFNKKNYNYYITCFIIGLLYDIVYTNTFLLNGIIYIILGFLIKLIYKKININTLKIILEIIFFISIYRILTFIILNILGYNFNISSLLESIYSSIILNIIYTFLSYNILILNKKWR